MTARVTTLSSPVGERRRAKDYGPGKPAAANESEDGRGQNHRVELLRLP